LSFSRNLNASSLVHLSLVCVPVADVDLLNSIVQFIKYQRGEVRGIKVKVKTLFFLLCCNYYLMMQRYDWVEDAFREERSYEEEENLLRWWCWSGSKQTNRKTCHTSTRCEVELCWSFCCAAVSFNHVSLMSASSSFSSYCGSAWWLNRRDVLKSATHIKFLWTLTNTRYIFAYTLFCFLSRRLSPAVLLNKIPIQLLSGHFLSHTHSSHMRSSARKSSSLLSHKEREFK